MNYTAESSFLLLLLRSGAATEKKKKELAVVAAGAMAPLVRWFGARGWSSKVARGSLAHACLSAAAEARAEGGAFALGPVHSVVLRAGDGPFAQESPVWLGAEDGSEPEVAFRGADEVEIRTGTCVLVSRVEAGTLEVDPVHRGTDGC